MEKLTRRRLIGEAVGTAVVLAQTACAVNNEAAQALWLNELKDEFSKTNTYSGRLKGVAINVGWSQIFNKLDWTPNNANVIFSSLATNVLTTIYIPTEDIYYPRINKSYQPVGYLLDLKGNKLLHGYNMQGTTITEAPLETIADKATKLSKEDADRKILKLSLEVSVETAKSIHQDGFTLYVADAPTSYLGRLRRFPASIIPTGIYKIAA